MLGEHSLCRARCPDPSWDIPEHRATGWTMWGQGGERTAELGDRELDGGILSLQEGFTTRGAGPAPPPASPRRSPLEGEPAPRSASPVPQPHLLLQHHADRALLVQLLPELDHLPPQVLGLLVLPNVRRADALVFVLRPSPLRGGAAELLPPRGRGVRGGGSALVLLSPHSPPPGPGLGSATPVAVPSTSQGSPTKEGALGTRAACGVGASICSPPPPRPRTDPKQREPSLPQPLGPSPRSARGSTWMNRLSWVFCCSSRVFSCSREKMYSAVCWRMAACGRARGW